MNNIHKNICSPLRTGPSVKLNLCIVFSSEQEETGSHRSSVSETAANTFGKKLHEDVEVPTFVSAADPSVFTTTFLYRL